MNELKIEPELRDLLPPLSGDEKRQLEENLLKVGYVGAPIYIWNGYIVDGHNRYEICQKHHINYPTEELNLGDSATKTDVMEWMINTQLGRRNLIPAQRLVILDKFKKKVQEEARKRQSEAGGVKKSSSSKNCLSPNREKIINSIHTDKILAKMAGVGTGTVARFNQVMKSEDEDLKNDVITGKLSINAGYKKIKEKKIDNAPEQQSDLAKKIQQIATDMKKPRYISDYWNFTNEMECLQYEFDEFIDGAFDRLFGEFNISGEVITQHEKENAIHCIDDFIRKIQELKENVEKVNVKSISDEKLNTLITCLSAVGYKLRTPDIQDTFGVISASDTIENIFSELGRETFLDLITLHQAIWNGDKLSLQASFLKGFAKFYITYLEQIDTKRCIAIFSKSNIKRKTPLDIKKESDDDRYNKDVGIRYAKVFTKYYNSNLSKEKKLKMSKLEY